jgi:hypothetical protein
MQHKYDKQPIKITYIPVSLRDATEEQLIELEKPFNKDEIAL